MHWQVCSVVAACATGSAFAQVQVRLEFRLVPQTGTLTSSITDQPVGQSVSIDTFNPDPAALRHRFELQYRLIDTDTSDAVTPAGLIAASLEVNNTVSGQTAGCFLTNAPLSNYEARLADASPPGPIDSSGPALIGGPYTGIHRPFRGGLSSDSSTSNGGFVGLAIAPDRSINVLSLAPNDQGNIAVGLTGFEWYGLYSFEFVAAPMSIGTVMLTFFPEADPTTHNSFAFYKPDGTFTSAGTSQVTPGTATILLVPAPGAGLGVGICVVSASSRRRQSSSSRSLCHR